MFTFTTEDPFLAKAISETIIDYESPVPVVKEIDPEIGKQLLILRTKAQLTQAALASFSGINSITISRIETSKQIPRPQTLNLLISLCKEQIKENEKVIPPK